MPKACNSSTDGRRFKIHEAVREEEKRNRLSIYCFISTATFFEIKDKIGRRSGINTLLMLIIQQHHQLLSVPCAKKYTTVKRENWEALQHSGETVGVFQAQNVRTPVLHSLQVSTWPT